MAGATKRVTLKEIANKTGYSTMTISKALRNCDDISLDTRRYICETANRMGYVMNGAANALRSGKSRCIALSLVDITNNFWSLFARHSEEIARKNGYSIFIQNVDMCPEREKNAIHIALQQGVDGMLLDPSQDYRKNVQALMNAHVPFIILENPTTDASMNSVTCDQSNGVYIVAQYMIKRGCKKILFLNYDHFPWRTTAFLQGLKDSGVSGKKCMVHRSLSNIESRLSDIIQDALREHPDIDGLFAFNDAIAYECICIFHAMGKRVPEDICVVGNGDTESFLPLPVSLTSIHSSPIDLAEQAMSLLLENMASETPLPPRHIVLPVTLTKRNSC